MDLLSIEGNEAAFADFKVFSAGRMRQFVLNYNLAHCEH